MEELVTTATELDQSAQPGCELEAAGELVGATLRAVVVVVVLLLVAGAQSLHTTLELVV